MKRKVLVVNFGAAARVLREPVAFGSYAAPQIGHLDAALTNFAIGYRNGSLVADILCPRVPVGRQSDKYYIQGRENQQVKGSTLRAPGAPAARKRISLSMDAYFCQSHAQACELPDENNEIPSIRSGRAQMLTDTILLDKEIAAAAMLTDTTKVTQNTTLAGNTQFSDGANSDPEGVVETGRQAVLKSGFPPNTIICGPDVFAKLKVHPKIKDAFKYTAPGAIGVAQLAAFFQIAQFIVASAVKVDDAGAASWVWGKDMLIAYVQPTPGDQDVSLAKTFVWEGAPGTIGGIGTVIGRNPDPTAKSEILGVDFYYDQKITAVAGGYLIKAAVA